MDGPFSIGFSRMLLTGHKVRYNPIMAKLLAQQQLLYAVLSLSLIACTACTVCIAFPTCMRHRMMLVTMSLADLQPLDYIYFGETNHDAPIHEGGSMITC